MDPETIVSIAVVVPGILTAIAVLWGVIWSGWKTRGELVKIAAEIEQTKAATTDVQHQVKPNGGSSMRDSVERTARDVREIRTDQLLLWEEMARLRQDGVRTHRELSNRLTGVEKCVKETCDHTDD